MTFPVTVGAITGIPQLYEAVPISGTAVIDTPAAADKAFVAGLFKGTPSTSYEVTFRTAIRRTHASGRS